MKNRSAAVDLLRTFAILIMLVANSAAYLLNPPHPVFFRILLSLAAPLFIFLSGFSFHTESQIKSVKSLQKSFYLLATAIFVDTFIWRIAPFQTFDVLYLIAFGLLVNYLVRNLNLSYKAFLVIIILFVYLFFLYVLEYRFENPDLPLVEISDYKKSFWILFNGRRFLIDGWFPVLPWVTFSILGSLIASESKIVLSAISSNIWKLTFILLLLLYFLCDESRSRPLREDYLEVFYPPSFLYLAFASLFFVLLYSLFKKVSYESTILRYLCSPGRNSLVVYIFHCTVLSFIAEKYLTPVNNNLFICWCLLFVFVVYALAFMVEKFKTKSLYSRFPVVLKKLFGL